MLPKADYTVVPNLFKNNKNKTFHTYYEYDNWYTEFFYVTTFDWIFKGTEASRLKWASTVDCTSN